MSNWGYYIDPKTKKFAKWPKRIKKHQRNWIDDVLAMVLGFLLGVAFMSVYNMWDVLIKALNNGHV